MHAARDRIQFSMRREDIERMLKALPEAVDATPAEADLRERLARAKEALDLRARARDIERTLL